MELMRQARVAARKPRTPRDARVVLTPEHDALRVKEDRTKEHHEPATHEPAVMLLDNRVAIPLH